MTTFLLRGASVVLSTQWNVMDMCAAEMALTFAGEVRRSGVTPAAALKTAQAKLRQAEPVEILGRMKDVEKWVPPASPEAGKLLAQKAWLYLRSGLIDEAVADAERASGPLRAAGLGAEAETLLDRTRHARRHGLPDWFQRTKFDSPVFWGAFQLVGRVT